MQRALLAAALAASGAAAAPPTFNATAVNHLCLVTRDFNRTARAYALLFGGAPPVGRPALHSWNWYRGRNTTAQALLVHAPGGPRGFSLEIISPLDGAPSVYNELLAAQGNSAQHVGINVDPPGSIDAARAALAAAGYETVQMGQGAWGCYAYVWMRDDFGTILELLDPGNLACRCPS